MEPGPFRQEENDAAMKRFDDGAPLPAVDPDYLQRMWEIMPGLDENKAIGLGAIAGGMGSGVSTLQGDTMIALMMRAMLLKSLAARGVFRAYGDGDGMRPEVFLATATIPCNRDDVAEALGLDQLAKLPPEQAAPVLELMRTEGYDPQHPRIDEKILAWMRDNG